MNAPTGFDLVERQGGQRRSDRRHAESDGVPADAAHDAGRLRRHRLRGGGDPRLPAAASTATTPSTGARWPSRCWSARRRRCSSRSPATSARAVVAEYQPAKLAAMEAHFETGRARAAPASAAGPTWTRRDAVRDQDPGRAVAAGLPRSRRRGARGSTDSRARTGPTSRSCTSRFRSWWRSGTLPGARGALGRMAGLPAPATVRHNGGCSARWRSPRRWDSSPSRPGGR